MSDTSLSPIYTLDSLSDLQLLEPTTTNVCMYIYVKLGPYVMNTVAVLETSAKDRFYAGVCFRWLHCTKNSTDC